jgi:hypothetical protein
MKIDPNRVIKTKPKMIKEGYGLSDLFITAALIGALIQLAIQLYLNL